METRTLSRIEDFADLPPAQQADLFVETMYKFFNHPLEECNKCGGLVARQFHAADYRTSMALTNAKAYQYCEECEGKATVCWLP